MSRVGGRGANRSGVQYATSAYDDDERAGGAIRDKKFEGYSNLAQAAEKIQRAVNKKEKQSESDAIHEDIILNLHKQIAYMETQIKLLKDREVDQKNQASCYETLLRDGIPLNEHFLALKNKYNNEQGDLRAEIKAKEEDIEREEESNANKRLKIESNQNELKRMIKRFDEYQESQNKTNFDLESTKYSQIHQKGVVKEDNTWKNQELQRLRGDNAVSDRAIRQGKLGASKKEAAERELKEEREKLAEDVTDLNKEIIHHSWILDQQRRKRDDKNLTKMAQQEAMKARQAASNIAIDLSICESRIKDLENQQEMCYANIREELEGKRKVDKENQELDDKINMKGEGDAEKRRAYEEAQRELTKRKMRDVANLREDTDILLEQLKEEEKKCKDMLDAKIDAEQTLELCEEDYQEAEKKRRDNRDEIARRHLKLEQLRSQKKTLTADKTRLTAENTILLKDNEKYEVSNEKMQNTITDLLQRIEISTLLKEIDQDEMRHLKEQNDGMNEAFISLINKWERIPRFNNVDK